MLYSTFDLSNYIESHSAHLDAIKELDELSLVVLHEVSYSVIKLYIKVGHFLKPVKEIVLDLLVVDVIQHFAAIL